MKINVDRWFSIVRSSIDACWVTSVIEWCQEWIVKKKRGKNKINKIIIQLREQIEKLYRWKCTNFLFYLMKKKTGQGFYTIRPTQRESCVFAIP